MRDEGGVLNRWKERGLFALAAAALVAYAVWLALARASGNAPAGARARDERDEKDQRYVRASGGLVLPADAEGVFAGAEPEAYFDASLRRVWVEPRPEEVKVALRLDAPPPTVPAPPMLLPVPGPTLGFTSALRRWPEMPAEAVEEEEPVDVEPVEEAGPAAREPALPRSALTPRRRPKPAARPQPGPRRPASPKEGRAGRRQDLDDEALRERLRRLQRLLREKSEKGGEE